MGTRTVDYVRYYGPAVVEMGIPLCYIPLVLTTDGALQDSCWAVLAPGCSASSMNPPPPRNWPAGVAGSGLSATR